MKILIYFLFFLIQMRNISSEISIKSTCKFNNHFASKTPYRLVANNAVGPLEFNDCTPLKIWMMVRHGTRTPNVKTIVQMKTRLHEIRALILAYNREDADEVYISKKNLEWFRKWNTTLLKEDEKRLTIEGEEEMIGLAERMQSRFPSILSKTYSNTSYYCKYTTARRTKQSGESFNIGLFGKNTAAKVWFPEPSDLDLVLRFYKSCSGWKDFVKRNGEGKFEIYEFIESDVMEKTLTEVNSRLGFGFSELSFDDIHLLYTVCAFETSWTNKGSPWCIAFANENLKVFEYFEDLKYYWSDGYGHELTYKQACPTMKDLISKFIDESIYPKAIIYFTHFGTLIKFICHLGFYKDGSHLTATNYNRYADDRKWKTKLIGPFASNVAFVLFDCRGVKKVLFMHQEQVTRLMCCPTSDLCDLDTIIRYYDESINHCDFDEMCKNKK